MFIEFTEECQKMLLNAKKEMQKLNHPYVGSEHFLLAILNEENEISKELSKHGVSYEGFKNRLIELIGVGIDKNDWFLFTPLFKRVIEDAILEAKDRNYKYVTLENLFSCLLEEGEGVAIRILMSLGINIDRLYNEYISTCKKNRKKKDKKTTLDEFGIDLTDKAKNKEFDPVIGRENELNQIIEVLLRRKKNNPLLIGKAGVGKTAIVEELANRIVKGKVPKQLENKRIISLSMAALVSGTKYRGEFEERLNKIIRELEKNRDIIIFIDEIHTLVGAGGAEGAIDASNIFKPVLSRGDVSVIGATTEREYSQYMESDKALERRFQTICIDEPSEEETLDILKKIKDIYEDFYNIEISEQILVNLIELSNKYIFKNNQPDKAIEILDSACCKASLIKSNIEKNILKYKEKLNNLIEMKNNSILDNDFNLASKYLKEEKYIESQLNMQLLKVKNVKKKKITMNHIVSVIESKSQVPIYEYKKNNSNIATLLKKVVIGQDNIIDSLVFETYRKLYGLKYNKKPLSFLFVGPTGVGKTFLAESYNKLLYNNNNLIRLDMSEYGESYSISKILGSPAGYVGYNDANNILLKIKNKPNAILLLDEIEKASKEVINLFLQILDNGVIKDSKGEEIRFDHVTIIMTSNLGFKTNSIGFHNDINGKVINNVKRELGIEFVNRINKVLVFNSLDEKSISQIINLEYRKKVAFYRKKGIKLSLNKRIKNKIIKKSKYEDYGARQISKILEDELDSFIINKELILN